jgi:acyl-CoA thioester hydrolase
VARHEKRIEVRWRDVDKYGHVNNAVYLTYLEEVRDEWLLRVLADPELAWDYVLAHVSIDFRHEVTLEDDEVIAICRLDSVGQSSVRTREEVRTPDGVLAAESSSVIVARDREAGTARPVSAEERSRFEAARATPDG